MDDNNVSIQRHSAVTIEQIMEKLLSDPHRPKTLTGEQIMRLVLYMRQNITANYQMVVCLAKIKLGEIDRSHIAAVDKTVDEMSASLNDFLISLDQPSDGADV